MAHIPVKKKNVISPRATLTKEKQTSLSDPKHQLSFPEKLLSGVECPGGLLFCDPLPHHNGCTLEMCYREPARDEKKKQEQKVKQYCVSANKR